MVKVGTLTEYAKHLEKKHNTDTSRSYVSTVHVYGIHQYIYIHATRVLLVRTMNTHAPLRW